MKEYKIKFYKDKFSKDNRYEYYANLEGKTNTLFSGWNNIGIKKLNSIVEDLLIITLSVFVCDKKFIRSNSHDNWTREFEISVPVLNIKLFNDNILLITKILNFLTGDIWNIIFEPTDKQYWDKLNSNGNSFNYDEVSLFSGGLDSFIYSLEAINKSKNIMFVSHIEYSAIKKIQSDLLKKILNENLENKSKHSHFDTSRLNVNRMDNNYPVETKENTTRGRSLLFIMMALSYANSFGPNVEVIVPENGFIGINVPLTDSRFGSLSTRTTHPEYIGMLNELLSELGLPNKIVNPYTKLSKSDMVKKVRTNKVFINNHKSTISCSHPIDRFNGNAIPQNCGYCYPCIIRQISLGIIGGSDYRTNINTDFNTIISNGSRWSDLISFISLTKKIRKISNDDLAEYISLFTHSHPVDNVEVARIYRETTDIFYKLVSKNIKELID